MMLAKMTEIPEWGLDPSESKEIAEAVNRYLDLHPVGIDPSKIALANLCMVTGMVAATHYGAYRLRVKKEAATGRPQPVPMAPRPAQPAATGPAPAPAPFIDPTAGARSPADMWSQNGVLNEGYSPAI